MSPVGRLKDVARLQGWVYAVLASATNYGCVIPLSNATPGDGGASNDGVSSEVSGGDDGSPSGDGPPLSGWSNATSTLSNLPSECGNMSFLSAKPDEDVLIAGIAQDGLWASRNGGASWQPLGASDGGPGQITNRTSSIVYDPTNPMRFWESGIYNSTGVYETTDDGNTFVPLGSSHHNDLVSIDFSDPQRRTLLAGTHEQPGMLIRSTDGGQTWVDVSGNLPTDTNCTLPLVIDVQTHLVGCSNFNGPPNGIYRTVNGGAMWTKVSASGGGAAPLWASDQSIYWASPGGAGMTRSVDNGQTWTDVVGSGVIRNVHPIELPDHRLATLSTQHVVVSADHGATWTPVTGSLPYSDATGLTYSAQEKAFFIWHFTCGNSVVPVPSDAVMRSDFDYQK